MQPSGPHSLCLDIASLQHQSCDRGGKSVPAPSAHDVGRVGHCFLSLPLDTFKPEERVPYLYSWECIPELQTQIIGYDLVPLTLMVFTEEACLFLLLMSWSTHDGMSAPLIQHFLPFYIAGMVSG